MKIKKIIVAIAISTAVVLGFTSCLGDGSGGYNYSYSSPAVIEFSFETMKQFLRTYHGSFVPDNTSAVDLVNLPDGSCIYASFEYDSDYQTGDYPVASKIVFQSVGIDNIQPENEEMINRYTYPFTSVELFRESLSPNYNGKFFVATNAKLAQNQALSYYLYTKPDEDLDATGTRSLYLQAFLPENLGGTQDVTTVRALEMRSLINSSGRDTTINEGGISYSLKYLKLNLKYCSKIENGAPVFESALNQPFFVYVFKNES
jgi:hypothetical protein